MFVMSCFGEVMRNRSAEVQMHVATFGANVNFAVLHMYSGVIYNASIR